METAGIYYLSDILLTDPPYGTDFTEGDIKVEDDTWQNIRKVVNPDGLLMIMGYAPKLFEWGRNFSDIENVRVYRLV